MLVAAGRTLGLARRRARGHGWVTVAGASARAERSRPALALGGDTGEGRKPGAARASGPGVVQRKTKHFRFSSFYWSVSEQENLIRLERLGGTRR